MNFLPPARPRSRSRRRAMTLVEILASLAVASLLLAAIAAIVVMSSKVMRKNMLADEAVTATRTFQEHLNHAVSMAVADPPALAPQYAGPSSTTPIRYSRLTYRTVIGPFGKVRDLTLRTSSTLVVSCPAGLGAQVGDYLMMDSPNVGTGARILAVDDQRAANTQGDITLTLGNTIVSYCTGIPADVLAGASVSIQRQSAYQTMDSSKYPGLVEMRWYSTTIRTTPRSSATPRTLSSFPATSRRGRVIPSSRCPAPMSAPPSRPSAGSSLTRLRLAPARLRAARRASTRPTTPRA